MWILFKANSMERIASNSSLMSLINYAQPSRSYTEINKCMHASNLKKEKVS